MRSKLTLFLVMVMMLFFGCNTPQPIPSRTTISPASQIAAQAPEPTLEATLITPAIKGTSIGAYQWSPGSRWLPYVDYNAQTLHFYDASSSTTCDFPMPILHPNPNHFLAWLSGDQVVVQAADKVVAGQPCGAFQTVTPAEIRVLDHTDPSFSPDGRYQVVLIPFDTNEGSNPEQKKTIILKDAASGEKLVETNFRDMARGGGNLPGEWLDATHFLITATEDQGPLLLTPGKPAIQVAAEIFHQPLKPGGGTNDFWQAITAVRTTPPNFFFYLIGTADQVIENPLEIYASETGQVETLPNLAKQAHFSNDGHWLLIDQTSGPTQIRPIDAPGAPFSLFSTQPTDTYRWSPDGSKVFGMSGLAAQQSIIWLYASPQKNLLGAWQAPGYELTPSWSPDGKYLVAWGRQSTDYNQEAIFIIRVPN